MGETRDVFVFTCRRHNQCEMASANPRDFLDKPLGKLLLQCLQKVPGGYNVNLREQVDAMATLTLAVCPDAEIERFYDTGSVIAWLRGPTRSAPVFLDAHLDTWFDMPAGRVPQPAFDERGYLHSPWLDNRVGCALLLHVGSQWAELRKTAAHDLALIFPGNEEGGYRGKTTGASVIARLYEWAEGAVFDVSDGEEPPPRLVPEPVARDMTPVARVIGFWSFEYIMRARIGWGPIVQRSEAALDKQLVVWQKPTVASWQQTDKPPIPKDYPNDIRDYAPAGVPRLRYLAIGVAGNMHSADSWMAPYDVEQAAIALMQFAREMISM